jgi:general stress protein 26
MNVLLGILLAVGLCLVGMAHGANALSNNTKTSLESEKEIYTATQRSNGEWSTAAPVWFMYDGEAIYFTTSPTSYKARRIKRGSPVRLWVGSKDGPSFVGEAQFVTDPATVERMAQAYKQRYWLAWLGLFLPRVGRIESGKTVAIKVTPLADGAASETAP